MGCLPSSSSISQHLDGVNFEMHSEALIEQVRICSWRPDSSEFADQLEGCDRANLKMHIEAVIERVW